MSGSIIFSLSAVSISHTLLAIPLILIATCLLTWLITTFNFSRSIAEFKSRETEKTNRISLSTQQSNPITPPVLPYAIPWLGSALTFLNENPGSFWRMLRARLAHTGTNVQICTILLGGKRAHVVNSAAAVQVLFKSRHVSRDLFNHQLATQALGTSKRDAELMFPSSSSSSSSERHQRERRQQDKKDSMDAVSHEFLLNQSAVNALTGKFMEYFCRSLNEADLDLDLDREWKTVDLLAWMKKIMFDASVVAVFGTKILDMNPDLAEQFWKYESGFLPRFYGVPRFVKPSAYACRDELLDRTQSWVEYVLAEHGGSPPGEPDWEPLLGSKVVRARHRFYAREGLSTRGRAAFDLGFLFGLAANVVPATNWLLAHLLSPSTPDDVLRRVRTEVEYARRPRNDVVDMAVLMAQPLLNSVFNETMRRYVDCLVTRQLETDMVVDGYLLRKGDLIMAPSSLSQHDTVFWEQNFEPSADTWYAERFIRHDETPGKQGGLMSSTSWCGGKFFPFGGGSHACPGRVFAKQKILGAVAAFLMQFDVEFVEFLGTDRKGNVVSLGTEESAFPKVKQQYAGNGTLAMDGDIRVRIRRR
ncbi:hypothetical protein LTR41_003958 [Exophiala xenobiotica]|nr:hypothetical protein LTR41_003958 [Exophiala xenobiotica]